QLRRAPGTRPNRRNGPADLAGGDRRRDRGGALVLSFGLNAWGEHTQNLGIFPIALNDTVAFTKPYQVAFDAEDIDRRNVYSSSFDVHYSGRAVELTSVTGYQRTFRGTGPGGTEADASTRWLGLAPAYTGLGDSARTVDAMEHAAAGDGESFHMYFLNLGDQLPTGPRVEAVLRRYRLDPARFTRRTRTTREP